MTIALIFVLGTGLWTSWWGFLGLLWSLTGECHLFSAASYLQSSTKNANMAYCILFHFTQPNIYRKHSYYKDNKIIQQIVEGAEPPSIIKFILSETSRIQDTSQRIKESVTPILTDIYNKERATLSKLVSIKWCDIHKEWFIKVWLSQWDLIQSNLVISTKLKM